LKRNLTATEIEILNARETGNSFCDLSKEDFEISITGILLAISVICGCQLPTNPMHIELLEKEFGIFLNDNGYSGLTYEEILTAFRMNANFKLGEKVESYGAIFNINYAAQVLRLYREKRGHIDEIGEKMVYNIEVKKELKKEDDGRKNKIIEQFNKYLQDENTELDLSNFFMQLRSDGAFSNKKIDDELTYRRSGETELSRLIGESNLDERFNRERKMVKFLFENMKKSGRLKVYDENLNLLHPGFELPQDMFLQPSDPNEKLVF